MPISPASARRHERRQAGDERERNRATAQPRNGENRVSFIGIDHDAETSTLSDVETLAGGLNRCKLVTMCNAAPLGDAASRKHDRVGNAMEGW
jgi:hypothetical protein